MEATNIENNLDHTFQEYQNAFPLLIDYLHSTYFKAITERIRLARRVRERMDTTMLPLQEQKEHLQLGHGKQQPHQQLPHK